MLDIAFSESRRRPVFISSFSSTANSTASRSNWTDTSDWKPVQVSVDDDWAEFSALAKAWKDETSHLSSLRRKYESPAYQKIVDLGSKAIPLIIRQLQAEGPMPYHWWDALRELTGTDPVPVSVGGNIREAARIWVEWWDKNAGQLGP